jgi:hypothetical protein
MNAEKCQVVAWTYLCNNVKGENVNSFTLLPKHVHVEIWIQYFYTWKWLKNWFKLHFHRVFFIYITQVFSFIKRELFHTISWQEKRKEFHSMKEFHINVIFHVIAWICADFLRHYLRNYILKIFRSLYRKAEKSEKLSNSFWKTKNCNLIF